MDKESKKISLFSFFYAFFVIFLLLFLHNSKKRSTFAAGNKLVNVWHAKF